MVMRYGMHAKLGHVAYEAERPAFLQVPWMPPATRDCSEDTAREIDNAVRELVQGAFEKALAILRAQRETLDRGARELLAKETLGEEDLRRRRKTSRRRQPSKGGQHMKTSIVDIGGLFSALGVEKQLAKLPGVHKVEVNYVAGSATVVYDETVTDLKAIKARVHECGYHCTGEMLPMHMCVPEDPPHNG